MPRNDSETGGRYVDIGDTRLYVVERGDGQPLLVFEENGAYVRAVRDFLGRHAAAGS